MYLAYTYLITNKITNEYYYGSRFRNIALKRMPDDAVEKIRTYQTGRKRSDTAVEKTRQSKLGTKRQYLPDGSFIMVRPDLH